MLLAAGGLGLVLSWMPTVAWPFEVLGNFVVQAVVVGSAVGMGFLAVRAWGRAGVAFLLVALWALPWLGRSGEAPSGPTSPVFTLSLHNVLRTNATPERVAAEVVAWDPDLTVLEEVSEAWTPVLDGLSGTWPHGVFQPADHNFGIAARSKVPFVRADVRYLVGPPAEDLPALDLTVDAPFGPVHILAVHFVPPVSGVAARVRAEQVRALVDLLGRPDLRRTAVVGDLNTTPFSETYRRLLGGTGLRDVRDGRGLLPTWPAGMPELLRLSLDHVLVSPDLAAARVEVGDVTGSDHRGVVVALSERR